MMYSKFPNVSRVLFFLGAMAFVQTAVASDTDELTSMLNEFLAGAATESAHERFWADDLIYTSSSGTRTNKAEIMQGFAAANDDAETVAENSESEEPGPVYTAEDIQIQLHGTTAVVAFRLVGTTTRTSDASPEVQQYFNTGTFVKRDGMWKVVAWQATIIPGN
jgi:hypothetical protein